MGKNRAKAGVFFAAALLLSAVSVASAERVTLPYVRESSTVITAAIPPENPAIAGENPLTGELWSGEYHPILVQTDADPNALPHWGVSSADITYELPLYMDGNTRQLVLFMSEIPVYAGPVRSARVNMASIRQMWDAAWVFAGTQEDWKRENPSIDVGDFVQTMDLEPWQGGRWAFPFLNGLDGNYNEMFVRQHDGEHVAPHNLAVLLPGVESLFSSQPKMHPFRFADAPQTRGASATEIYLDYKTTRPAFASSYIYDEGSGMYFRFREGMPYRDGLNGETCSYANVIVVHTHIDYFNNVKSRPIIRLVGQGTADIFQSGKWIRGTWVRGLPSAGNPETGESAGETKIFDRANQESRMVFLDDRGQEIELQRGPTFIQVVDEHLLTVSVETADYIEGGNPAPTPKPTRTPRPTRTPKPTRTPAPTRPPMRTVSPEAESYVVITGEIAKIRMRPETSGILLGYAWKDETFPFLGRYNRRWLRLQFPDGTTGYVNDGLADVVGEEKYKEN